MATFDGRGVSQYSPPTRFLSGPLMVYSRWRAGPTAFGPGVKGVVTAVILAILVVPESIVLFFIGRQMLMRRLPENTAAHPFLFVMSILGLTVGLVLLRVTWRRERVL